MGGVDVIFTTKIIKIALELIDINAIKFPGLKFFENYT